MDNKLYESLLDKNVYLVSDTHFGHKNILKSEPTRKKYIYRNIDPYNITLDDINAMNSTIIDRWNNIVNDNDIILHLGDIFINKHYNKKISSNLNGNIYFIHGNHDHPNMIKRIKRDSWNEINYYIDDELWSYNMREYFNRNILNNDETIEHLVSFIICKIDNKVIMFSHFPIYVDMDDIIKKNLKYEIIREHLNNIALLTNVNINIHGHVHSNKIVIDKKYPNIKHFNVSIENTDMQPIKLEDILNFL